MMYTSNILLLLSSSTYASTSIIRQSEEDEQIEVGSGLDMNDTNSTLFPPGAKEPILSASAIANIICSVLAIILLTAVLCYLMRTFNKTERDTRLMTTRENNRRIDRQVAAAKARVEQSIKEATEHEQKSREAGVLQDSRETLNIFEELASGPSSVDKTLTNNLPLLSGEPSVPTSGSTQLQVIEKSTHTQVVDLMEEELMNTERT